ncbi:MAG: hypothetical protein K6G57_01730, partial [Lachnospiraceae bacterium]|nr:hypothetical protein [Lachnospiraceae bacterium]
HLKDDEKSRLHRIHVSSRDSSRTPVQWNDGKYAGFSDVKPWFYVNPNYRSINVEAEEKDENSILNYYRRCLSIRQKSKTLLFGSYREYEARHPYVYMYERKLGSNGYIVICSFAPEKIPFVLPKQFRGKNAKIALSNYPGKNPEGVYLHLPETCLILEPYEALLLKVRYKKSK